MENIKEKLINDMLAILFDKNDITSYSRNHIIDMYCWLLTERVYSSNDGKTKNVKYAGCNYWSELAINKYKKNSSANKYKGLKHEHVVPRRLFRKYLYDLIDEYGEKCPDKEQKRKIREQINDCFIGCVVTFEEAAAIDELYKDSFPDGTESLSNIKKENIWERYKNIDNIKIKEVEWEFTADKWSIVKETEINI